MNIKGQCVGSGQVPALKGHAHPLQLSHKPLKSAICAAQVYRPHLFL
jgi:hypothetical protein